MLELMRFALIVLIIAADDLRYEIVQSFNTTTDFLRHGVRWIVQDKLRVIWRGQPR
jgi:hypothetical protein